MLSNDFSSILTSLDTATSCSNLLYASIAHISRDIYDHVPIEMKRLIVRLAMALYTRRTHAHTLTMQHSKRKQKLIGVPKTNWRSRRVHADTVSPIDKTSNVGRSTPDRPALSWGMVERLQQHWRRHKGRGHANGLLKPGASTRGTLAEL